MDNLYDLLKRHSILLECGAQVYARGNVMLSYIRGSDFLLFVLCCTHYVLGLSLFTEDWYVVSFGSFLSFGTLLLGTHTAVLLLLFLYCQLGHFLLFFGLSLQTVFSPLDNSLKLSHVSA